jgi:hypothetical protein
MRRYLYIAYDKIFVTCAVILRHGIVFFVSLRNTGHGEVALRGSRATVFGVLCGPTRFSNYSQSLLQVFQFFNKLQVSNTCFSVLYCH